MFMLDRSAAASGLPRAPLFARTRTLQATPIVQARLFGATATSSTVPSDIPLSRSDRVDQEKATLKEVRHPVEWFNAPHEFVSLFALNRMQASPTVGGTIEIEVDELEFRHVSSCLLDEVQDALAEMALENNKDPSGTDKFHVVRHPDKIVIDLGPSGGAFELIRDCDTRRATLKAGTGTYTYAYNPVTREWKEIHTGDNLFGLLTRDLMRIRKGQPPL